MRIVFYSVNRWKVAWNSKTSQNWELDFREAVPADVDKTASADNWVASQRKEPRQRAERHAKTSHQHKARPHQMHDCDWLGWLLSCKLCHRERVQPQIHMPKKNAFAKLNYRSGFTRLGGKIMPHAYFINLSGTVSIKSPQRELEAPCR